MKLQFLHVGKDLPKMMHCQLWATERERERDREGGERETERPCQAHKPAAPAYIFYLTVVQGLFFCTSLANRNHPLVAYDAVAMKKITQERWTLNGLSGVQLKNEVNPYWNTGVKW